jgi:hypothetical protein
MEFKFGSAVGVKVVKGFAEKALSVYSMTAC